MSSFKAIVALGLMTTAQLVAGHGAITKAVGNAGGSGMALGIQSDTPRDGTRRKPFQQDSTRFKGDQKATVGETVGGGSNDLEAGTKAIMAETGTQLPQVTPGGEVDMTLHQVNADGAGPYTCMMNTDGTAAKWTDIQVTQSPPGKNSRNRDGAKTDFPLKAAIPQDASCTGTVAGQNNVCLIRCQNAARAGPFGGVVPVQMAGSSTPAAARRALAQAIKRDIQELKSMQKRAKTFTPEDLAGMYDEEDEEDEEEEE
ncbi:cas1 appressorium specific protein [Apiospora marii]|uniref:Cas1 appressorium specific protein n=1 Tax=Apiospora marii TaxID=335849 RepID=A0ABR1SGX2_9PEZI